MAHSLRRRGNLELSINLMARQFTIPAGYPNLRTVGYDAPEAPGGPVMRTHLAVAPANPVPTILNDGVSVDSEVYKVVQVGVGVTMTRCGVDNNSLAPVNYFILNQAISASAGSGSVTSINVIPGPYASEFILGTANNSNSDTLIHIQVNGGNTNQIESVYLGRQQNSDGSIDYTTVYQPTTNNDGSLTYLIAAINGSNNASYIGLQYAHQHGVFVQAPGNVGSSVTFTGSGYVLANYCSFGYALAPGGGADQSIDPSNGSRYSNTLVAYNGDAMKITTDMGFVGSMIGPNRSPSTVPGYHADGMQNVGGIHNDPTGDIWLDFTNQLSSGGLGSYKPSWTAHTMYNQGDYVVVMDPGAKLAQAKTQHTSGSTYSAEKSLWTESAADLLHVPGSSWTWSRNCSHIGYLTDADTPNNFKHIHSPFFFAAGTQNAGPVQNFLLWGSYITGGQSGMLDTTSVNSNNWNYPTTGTQAGPNSRGNGGCQGVIIGGGSMWEFIDSTGGGTIGTLSLSASPNATVIYTSCYVSDSTQFNLGSGSAQETLTAFGNAVVAGTNFAVTLANPLANQHNPGEALVTSTNPNAGQLAPNLSSTANPESSNNGSILSTTQYKYSLVNTVSGGATQLTLTSTYPTIVGSGVSGAPSTVTYGPMPSAGRTDSATVNSGSYTVHDATITGWDIGKTITGTGIPAQAFVGTVVAGVSFTITVNGTLTPAMSNGSSVNIGGVQLTVTLSSGAGQTVVVNGAGTTDGSGNYVVPITPLPTGSYPASTYGTTVANGVTSPVYTNLVQSDLTNWRELPRDTELSGDLSSLDLSNNYWGTVTDQNGNLVTLLDAQRTCTDPGWIGWPFTGQQAGSWENTSL